MTSSPPVPRMAAPSISSVFASTTIFMKPWVSPFSTARSTLVMGRLPTSALRPVLRTSASVRPARPSGGVDVQRIGRDAIAHPARVAIDKIRRDNLAIVERGVRERALAVAITERPDTRRAGAQLIIDDDVAALVPTFEIKLAIQGSERFFSPDKGGEG
jgi:hypothetical protein